MEEPDYSGFENMNIEDMPVLTIKSEDGEELQCSVLGIFEVDGYENEYIALMPEDSDEDVLIFRYNEYRDGNYEISNIEDDNELYDVEEAFNEIFDFEYEENFDVEIDDEFIYEDDDE